MRAISTAQVLTIVFSLSLVAGCAKGPGERQLFEQAKKYQEESKFTEATVAYEDLVKKYPESRNAPQCLFMVGYLYANHLGNMEKARQAYQLFLEKYPNHALVKDARWELAHLGQDVNEIPSLNELLQSSADSLAGGGKPDTTPPK
jgi:TolA-binding protein